MEYNLGKRSGTLVGNWMENRTLEAVGSPARVHGAAAKHLPTADRVLPIPRDGVSNPDHWRTVARTGMADVLSKAMAPRIGPRAAQRHAILEKDAYEVATTRLSPEKHSEPMVSTTQREFKAYPSSEYRTATRRSTPAGGTTVRGSTVPDAAILPPPSYYTTTPITYYTCRAGEGVYAKGPTYSTTNIFAKAPRFTNPIEVCERGRQCHVC